MMITKRTILAALVFLAGAALHLPAAQAQGPPIKVGKPGEGPPIPVREDGAPVKSDRAIQGYYGDQNAAANLSSYQIQQLEEAREDFMDQSRDLRDQLQQQQNTLQSELHQQDPDSDRLSKIQAELSRLRADYDQRVLAYRLKVRKIAPDLQEPDPGAYGTGPEATGIPEGSELSGPGFGDTANMQPQSGRQAWQPMVEEDARQEVQRRLDATRNPNLQVGEVQEKGDSFEVNIVTRDGSLADQVLVDRRTGRVRPAY